jgi:hypothetical protein
VEVWQVLLKYLEWVVRKHGEISYRHSGLLLESYAACLSSKPLSSQ